MPCNISTGWLRHIYFHIFMTISSSLYCFKIHWKLNYFQTYHDINYCDERLIIPCLSHFKKYFEVLTKYVYHIYAFQMKLEHNVVFFIWRKENHPLKDINLFSQTLLSDHLTHLCLGSIRWYICHFRQLKFEKSFLNSIYSFKR